MAHTISDAIGWDRWVTPRDIRDKPVHRWYVFPHSFTDNLVDTLIAEWGLGVHDRLLDPFVGAGTTLVSSRENAVSARGFDLSPLAVFASNTKVADYCPIQIADSWQALKDKLQNYQPTPDQLRRGYPKLVRDALPDGRLEEIERMLTCFDALVCKVSHRNFFRLILLSLIPEFSQAVANGGWLRWLNSGREARELIDAFATRVEAYLLDVGRESRPTGEWRAELGDARRLPLKDDQITAVITSPPYPNRHDYSRVFAIELMLCFLDWHGNRKLRYQSFHSHPEARPKRPAVGDYNRPGDLDECIDAVSDARLRKMLDGYFVDMHLCLREIVRVCKSGARIGMVVGNAQYDGKAIMVDEFTAELGEQVGLICHEIRILRWRGNSAQQMEKYGRRPSRESIVLFRKK